MTTTNTPILRNFQFLLHNFESSKVNSKEFQPNEERQRLLIIKGATHRILSLAFKKETTKYVYSQRTKLEEDKKRKNGEEGAISVDIDASNGQMTKPSKPPKSLDLTKKSSQSAFRDSMDVSSRTVAFANTLKVSNDSNQISSDLSVMAFDQTKDSKKLFDFICRGYDLGKSYQLNPKKIFEDIDLSSFSSNVSLANVTKLEDLTQMKKKDGILLIFDPSTNTLGEEISIKLTYMKSIDLNTEEEVTKEYSFYSNGNYFGIKLIKDLSRGQQSPPYTNRDGFSSVQFDITKVSLPGWHTKFPIFVPAVKCRLELIGMEKFVKHASLVNNLTRLKFHASFSTGLKSGMRRIHEFLDRYILQEASNIILPGGLSALNYACLHGNYEVNKIAQYSSSLFKYSVQNIGCSKTNHIWWEYKHEM